MARPQMVPTIHSVSFRPFATSHLSPCQWGGAGGEDTRYQAPRARYNTRMPRLPVRPLLISTLAVPIVTLVMWMLRDVLTLANVWLVFALLVLIVAIRFGTWMSLYVTAMSYLSINYFLIEPFNAFLIDELHEVGDLIVFILVGTIAGNLALRAKKQAILLEQSKLVAQADQLKTALLHSVSHDLRTPLTIIQSSAQNLKQFANTLPQDERAELVENIDREARVLNQMIGQLLDMSRLEAKAMPMTLELNSLAEVAGDAAGQTFARLGVRRLRLNFPDDMPLVPFDYGLILRVVSNLVDNALRYEPSDQHIEIRGTTTPSEARFAVINHGAAVPDSQRDILFQPFKPGKDGRLGLGLAIAHGIIEAHHGRIWMEDTPGGGTTFVFALPLAQPASDQRSASR